MNIFSKRERNERERERERERMIKTEKKMIIKD